MSAKIFAIVVLALAPAVAVAAWQTVATEPGRRVEIDRASIVPGAGAIVNAKGRIVLDKSIVDTKTTESYRIIEIESRYDCAERTHATLKRTYNKDESSVLREDEVRSPFDMPVRSGTPDGRLLREVCRPNAGTATAQPSGKGLDKMLEKVNDLAGDLRKTNDNLIDQAVKKDMQRIT